MSGYQWVIDGSQITKTDDDAPWPEAATVRPGDDIMIQLDGHHLPAAIEISVFLSLDPDHVEQEFDTDFYCYPLTGVQGT